MIFLICNFYFLVGNRLANRFNAYNSKYMLFYKKRLRILKYFFAMIIFAFMVYWGQKLLGIDPQWSVRMVNY